MPRLAVIVVLAMFATCHRSHAQSFSSRWRDAPDRVWVGSDFWANRLQDWRVHDGRLECVESRPGYPFRTVHLLTHRMGKESGELSMKVRTGLIDASSANPSSAAGFLLGAGGEALDHRAAAIIHHSGGPGAGLFCGVDAFGQVQLVDLERNPTMSGRFEPRGALSRRGWKVVFVDSAEAGDGGERILDGDPSTIWHTEWKAKRSPHPHEVRIDMGAVQSLGGVAYVPRQEQTAGRIKRFQLYLSEDGRQWGKPVSEGGFPDNGRTQRVMFPVPRAGRYLRLVALSSHGDRPSTTIAELFALSGAAPAADGDESVGKDERKPITDVVLELAAKQEVDSEDMLVTLKARDPRTDEVLSHGALELPAARLRGNLALVSHPGRGGKVSRYWFREWSVSGSQLESDPARAVGPILSTQYTLSRDVLKLTAQLMPVGESEPKTVQLQTLQGRQWRNVAAARLTTPGWTATFRVADWASSEDIPFRVVYGEANRDGWIRKDPKDKPTIVVAGFTGNHNNQHGLEGGRFDWREGMWFPHRDLTEQLVKHEPDLLFFSGDQVYEGASPTRPDHAKIKLDYLYKWYLWCWAFRDVTRDIPTIAIPDDHDVYQGNIWGEGGRATDKDDKGGYVHPADFVRMVERTQTGNLPDPYDPTPVAQQIGVYYAPLTYGRISFAILEDRKFKSGCNGRVPPSGSRRADHISDPDFDVRRADVPGLTLLGDRQLKFLDNWTADWRGADLKVALSQTTFANLATHHGPGLTYLRADLDSNGWPQSGRDRALRALRKGRAFHLCGDQHLATLAQMGVERHGDGPWAFCVPSIANFYPRAWSPANRGPYVFPDDEDYVGNHRDGLGNLVTVHAATNPGRPMGHSPPALHDRMPGYGIVKLDKPTRTIKVECWPRYADPATDKQYAGWPRTIRQTDNDGRQVIGYLPTLAFKADDPVVQVVRETSGEIVYTIRVRGRRFRPPVYAEGEYTVRVTTQDHQRPKAFRGLSPSQKDDRKLQVGG